MRFDAEKFRNWAQKACCELELQTDNYSDGSGPYITITMRGHSNNMLKALHILANNWDDKPKQKRRRK